MIKIINLQNTELLQELYDLQREAYLIEAKLINFFEIPPLRESLEELKNCREIFLGYFEGEELAGAISYTIDGEGLTICRMVVHPHHFRKGIAQSLLTSIHKKHEGKYVFKVSTGRDNAPAKSLYIKNGFQLVSEIEVVPGLYISNFEKK